MNTTNEEAATAQGASEKPKAGKKVRVAATRAYGGSRYATSAAKAKGARKAAKGAANAGLAREGSKTAAVLELLKRSEGASMKELLKATGWQPHSVRGFLSGAIRKKMAIEVTSTKGDDGQRTYSVKA
jgi:hypothetical protein